MKPEGTMAIRDVRFPQPETHELSRGTLLIRDGRVAEIHGSAPQIDPIIPVLEGADRILLPGFIDAHSHAESALGKGELELALLRQGLTGVVLGQDGVSFAPTTAESIRLSERYFSAVNGPAPAGYESGMSIDDFLTHFSRGTRINSATLVPAGTVRTAVSGFASGPLTDPQLDRAEGIVRDALSEGAAGISLGLEYVPNAFADPRELTGYAKIAADTGVPLVAHIRGYADEAARSLQEFLDLARTTGAPAHVSHLHTPADISLPLIDAALDEGIDVTFDSYPYRRGNTILAMLALPAHLQQDGPEATLDALADPSVRAELERHWFPSIVDLFPRLTITVASHSDWSWAEGLPLSTIAERAGLSPSEAIFDMLLATDLSVGAIVEKHVPVPEASVRAIANHRVHLGGTDGIYLGSHPHPRGWGGFARMLRRHVVDWEDWSWWDAAEHLSLRGARRFGFGDRGVARMGSIADFVLVDPHSLSDEASYKRPTALAHGMIDVTIAGIPVLRDGRLTDETPGRGIRDNLRSETR